MTDEQASPDLLRPPPQRGEGVRRLNRVPLMIAMAILVVIMGTIAYTYRMRMQGNSLAKRDSRDSVIGVLTGAPESGFIPPKAPAAVPVPRQRRSSIFQAINRRKGSRYIKLDKDQSVMTSRIILHRL
jgi:hypothetical protein